MEGEKMKTTNLRLPEELLNWTREKAARETIERGERVSINTVIVELIRQAKEADHRKGA
jgi:hypothetical protein